MSRAVPILLCLIMCQGEVPAADGKAQVVVRPVSQVSAVQIRLSDLADVTAADESLCTSLKDVPICAAPLPGHSRTISREQITSCLERRGFGGRVVSLLCPPQVTATRSATLVSGAQIFAAVREQIVSQARLSGRFEVEPLRLPRDQIVPAGRLEIRVGRPGATVRKGANTIPVSLFVDGRLYSTVNISVNVRVFAPVLVTTTAVPRGAELTDANTRLEDREVTLLGEDLVSPPLEPGLTAALALQEGEILRTSHVRSRPAIRSGDSVTVLVTAGPVRLSERGAAAQDGRVGERIKVRLAGEVREVRGIVRTSGLVHIDLNGKDSCDAQTL